MAAEKYEAEGTRQWAADLSRQLAAFDVRMSLAKRRKKKKSKNSD